MSKYYFFDLDEEYCFNKEYTKDLIREYGLKEKEVYEANLVTDVDFMFCTVADDIGDKGNCGKDCQWYKPRNKISGNCKFNRGVYEHGKKVILNTKT